jgi:hypothetical protein
MAPDQVEDELEPTFFSHKGVFLEHLKRWLIVLVHTQRDLCVSTRSRDVDSVFQ